ncbi:MAG: MFS transporter, partial [Candidatus Marinimicrobia bacterium]|nr:MFS transporter [Candidatus Neomarinimicrobiota bacterium]
MWNRLVRNRNLVLLWLGHVISHSGDAIYQIALPWLVLDLTGSKTTTSLVVLSAYLPAVVFSLASGVLADRFNRRHVMMFSDAVRMAAVLALVLYLLGGGVSPVIIGVIAFLVAAFATLFYPARDALIPDMVSPARLTSANAFVSTSGQFAHLAGPALAGFLVAWVGLTHLFTIDALSFGASLLFLTLISFHRTAPRKVVAQADSHLEDLKAGLRFVRREKALGLLLLLTALNNLFIMGPAIIGMPIFVREVLEMGFQAFAVIEALMAAGMLIGTALVWRYGARINPSTILFFGMVLDGLTYSLFFGADTYLQAKCLMLLHGIGIPMITIARTAIIQRAVPGCYRGRVFSMVNLSVVGLTAVSAAL